MSKKVRRLCSMVLLGLALIAALFLLLSLVSGCRPQPDGPATVSYGWIKVDEFTVTGEGVAGAATGSEDSNADIRGRLYAVHLDFNPVISVTTDFTLTQASPALTVLVLTNQYTDTWFYPGVTMTHNTGAGMVGYDHLPVNSDLTAVVGQAAANEVVTVTVWWGE